MVSSRGTFPALQSAYTVHITNYKFEFFLEPLWTGWIDLLGSSRQMVLGGRPDLTHGSKVAYPNLTIQS